MVLGKFAAINLRCTNDVNSFSSIIINTDLCYIKSKINLINNMIKVVSISL